MNFMGRFSALQVSFLVFVSFLLFYTMYDKVQKKLLFKKIIEVLFLTRGINHSLVELNKALSLSGLAILCLAFFPCYELQRNSFLFSALIQLLIHSVYSSWHYYGSEMIPYLTSFISFEDRQTMKKISIICGVAAQLILINTYFKYYHLWKLFSVMFGVAHFYLMEIDYKYILRVRPFAYIIFPLAGLSIFYNFAMY